jgi:hypothetical protein
MINIIRAEFLKQALGRIKNFQRLHLKDTTIMTAQEKSVGHIEKENLYYKQALKMYKLMSHLKTQKGQLRLQIEKTKRTTYAFFWRGMLGVITVKLLKLGTSVSKILFHRIMKLSIYVKNKKKEN